MHRGLQLSSTRTVPSKRKSSPRRNRGSSAEGTTRRLLRPTATKPDEQIKNPTCGNDAVPSLFAHVFLVQHDNRERNGEMQIHPEPTATFCASSGALEGPAGVGEKLEAGKLAGRLVDSRLAEAEKMPAPLPLEPSGAPSRIRSQPSLLRRAGLSESHHLLAERHRNSCRKPFSYPCRLQAERRSLGR